MKNNFKLSLVALALVAGSAAQAQSAGTWMARVGAIGLYPQVSSGDLSPPAFPNTQTDVSSDWTLGGGVTYMITDNWSVDVPLALPFTHTLTGAGAIAGVGTIGTTKALPIHDVGPVSLRRGQVHVPPLPGRGSDLCLLLRRECHQHPECPVRRHAVEPDHVLDPVEVGVRACRPAPPTPSTNAGSSMAWWVTRG